jgi:hypothetical protein
LSSLNIKKIKYDYFVFFCIQQNNLFVGTQVLAQTADHRRRVLQSAQKEIRTWIIKVEKIKSIYHTLNMFNFEVAQNSLIAECWCPRSALDGIYTALRNGEVTCSPHPHTAALPWGRLWQFLFIRVCLSAIKFLISLTNFSLSHALAKAGLDKFTVWLHFFL